MSPPSCPEGLQIELDLTFLDTMFDVRLALALGVVLVGGIVLGFAGFGTGLIFVALLSLIYNPREAVSLLVIMGTLGAAMLFPPATRHAIWREALPVAGTAILVLPLGSYVLLTLDQHTMQRAIGVVVLVLSFLAFRGITYLGPRGFGVHILAGLISGIVAGATALGRMLVALYFISAKHPPVVQRANIIVVGSTISLCNLIVLTLTGVITIELAARGAVLFLPFAATIWLGTRFFRATTAEWFRRIVSGLIMVISVATIIF